jgi:16S rRNA (cytosine1402-N4)-methyltransferase
VSSMQLDRADRGFSFQKDGPLDMRMAQDGLSAADFVNEADEAEIADIIYRYGEDHRSRRIARAIVAARPLETTAQLATVVRKAVGHKPGAPKDPATRAFQAIRIHVNRELDELTDGLEAAERMLKPGGRLAVVTFHSLEDRIVKQFLRRRSGAEGAGSRHIPVVASAGPASTFEKAEKAVRPSESEISQNPRSRSATLRSATRTAAPAWAEGGLAA